jgi:hypothetical protein
MITQTLLRISQSLRTQDNRGTENPMFVVQQKSTFGCEPGEGDENVWLNSDWEEVDQETSEKLDQLKDSFPWDLSAGEKAMLESHTQRGVKHFWVFCMASFTEEGCKEYLALNGHNLREPRIYVESWNRCPEMLAVRELLMAITASPKENSSLEETNAHPTETKMNSSSPPPPSESPAKAFLSQVKAAITHVEVTEKQLARQEARNQQLETLLKLLARRNDGKITWTASELEAAKKDNRCIMLGALDLDLYGDS